MSEFDKYQERRNLLIKQAEDTIRKAFPEESDFIPVKRVSEWTGISVNRLKANCGLPIKKIGGRYYATRLALVHWYIRDLL